MTTPNPTKTTAEKKASFVAALARRGTVYHAAKSARIDRTTAYAWRARDAKFAKAWDSAIEDAVDCVETSLFERACKGDTTAAIFILKCRRPEVYRETVRHELIEREAEKWAAVYGLDKRELLAEAERHLRAATS